MDEGAKEMLDHIDKQIRKYNLAKMFVASPAWKVFSEALSQRIDAVIRSLLDTRDLEKKAGMLTAYREMEEWAGRIERNLVFLREERLLEEGEGQVKKEVTNGNG
ncbi:MAG: hypothetical protein WC114_12695 [Smithellaceae bacterium]|jgi:hypothetical protein